MSQENGTILKWIMGLIASAFIMMTAGFISNLNSLVNEHHNMLAARGERIAHLESESTSVERRQNELKDSLEKIDRKLDLLMEKVKLK